MRISSAREIQATRLTAHSGPVAFRPRLTTGLAFQVLFCISMTNSNEGQKWPGVMPGLGCHDPAKEFQFLLHSPRFDMDERVRYVGVRLFGQALVRYLEKASAD